MKIKVFTNDELSQLEKTVNEFLNNHDLIKDIKFSTLLKDVDDMVAGNDAKLFYSVLVVYNE